MDHHASSLVSNIRAFTSPLRPSALPYNIIKRPIIANRRMMRRVELSLDFNVRQFVVLGSDLVVVFLGA